MADEFHDPHLTINRVYTRGGDKGQTSLVGGQRVAKDHLRIEAYGTVDELNAVVGLCRQACRDAPPGAELSALQPLDRELLRCQHVLFNLGSALSTLPEDMTKGQPRVTDEDVVHLEQDLDDRTPRLPPLKSFVLPGGSELNARLHVARTVCRRAERLVVALHREGGCDAVAVRYLNRLSDSFFVWSRAAAVALGHDEVLWQPNAAHPGD